MPECRHQEFFWHFLSNGVREWRYGCRKLLDSVARRGYSELVIARTETDL
jgi:hypothetical protein